VQDNLSSLSIYIISLHNTAGFTITYLLYRGTGNQDIKTN